MHGNFDTNPPRCGTPEAAKLVENGLGIEPFYEGQETRRPRNPQSKFFFEKFFGAFFFLYWSPDPRR